MKESIEGEHISRNRERTEVGRTHREIVALCGCLPSVKLPSKKSVVQPTVLVDMCWPGPCYTRTLIFVRRHEA